MEKFKSNPLVKTLGFNRIILVGVLIALYLLFSLFSGRVLGSVDIMNVLNSVDFMGFLTIGVLLRAESIFQSARSCIVRPWLRVSYLW